MIFHLISIKSTILAMGFLNDNLDLRDKFKSYLELENLFSKSLIHQICIFENKIHIGSDSFNNILDSINFEFGLNVDISLFKRYAKYSKEKIEFIKTCSFDDFKSVFSALTIEKIKKKKLYNANFKAPLPLDLKDKKLLSLDFEYRETKKDITILEMGITTSFNDNISYFHYVTTEKKKKKSDFNFGESILIDKNDFLKVFESHLDGVDYIVGHALDMEYKVLKSNGFDCSKIDNINFINTINVILNEFNINIDNTKVREHLSLKHSLFVFGIDSSKLHNAGNDSAYTLELTKVLVKKKVEHLESSTKKKKFTISVRMNK